MEIKDKSNEFLPYNQLMQIFETDRLRCQSLSLSDYSDFEAGLEPAWQGFTNPYRHLIEGPSPMVHRIPRVKKGPRDLARDPFEKITLRRLLKLQIPA